MHPARPRLVFFSAAIAVLAAVLVMVLPATIASAAGVSAAGNGVGASHPGMILAVGPTHRVSAGEGRCEAGLRAGFVSGACVAAEDTGDLAGAATCGGESFTAATKVLLASGAAIPISQLKPGDKVLATNTKTGKTSAEPVAAVLVHHDTDRYDLTVRTARGTAIIDTTSSHLFWSQTTRQWVKAAALDDGTYLRASDGAVVTVLGGGAPVSAAGWMWDLSIPGGGDHDFYVDTAIAAVLVHNCDISFGHGERHLIGTGLDQADVEATIEAQVSQGVSGASSTGSFWGRVIVDGQIVEYRAYTLPNGTINVGTYYVPPK
jgi:Pretoxin HINT domain